MWHADRGRLLLRTPGPVPYEICECSFVETTDTQSYITPVYDTFPWLDFLPSLKLLLNIGFHGASATGVACRQGTLTPPDTWSRPFGTCICSTCWNQSFSELVVILLDYALRISLGTFSILHKTLERNGQEIKISTCMKKFHFFGKMYCFYQKRKWSFEKFWFLLHKV